MRLFVAFAALLICATTPLYAGCVDQPRSVTLAEDNVAPLKGYLCSIGSGADAAQLRVEYYRLNDTVVSLLLTNGSSIKLRQTLGSVKIIGNDVSKTYADLVKRFGVTRDVPKTQGETATFLAARAADYKAPTPDGPEKPSGEDTIGPKKLRTLIGLADPVGGDYPAIAEITALRQKTIPNNLNFYYQSTAIDCDQGEITCRKFGDGNVTMAPWRYMTADDDKNFNANAKAYNAQLLKVRKDKSEAKSEFFQTNSMADDALEKFIANGAMPQDFSILEGRFQPVGCGVDSDLPGLAGWSFSRVVRVVRIDAVLLQNLSKNPLEIGGLFGESNGDGSLRIAQPLLAMPAHPVALDGISGTIPAGQAAIILTRIVFTFPPDQLAEFRKYRESMEAIHGAVGAMGFSGNVSAYQAPDPQDYTFGPTLAVTGATANSTRVDFTSQPVANFLELTSSNEAGSCPYLLSWDDTDREWITHGKVLHKGQNKDHAYTETVTFPDLRTRFRIEEREPELAHVQSLRLAIELRDGSTQTFSPMQPPMAAPGDPELTLFWGETADFSFAVPDTVSAADVVQTRLQVTGYYERYSNLLAQQESNAAAATPLPVRVNSAE